MKNDNLVRMKFNDSIKLKEKVNLDNKDNFSLRGHVIIRDAFTGEILVDEDNLITLSTRTFILELLFGLKASESFKDIDGNNLNTSISNRTVNLFKIGCGGADLNASPLEAFSPEFGDEDLNSEIPFIIVSNKKETLPEYSANPSVYSSLDDLDEDMKTKYYLPKTNEADGSIRYYGKTFENDSCRLKLNKDTGVVYWHGSLRITNKEARGFIINELGLLLSNFNGKEHTNVSLFSHICFSSIALSSLKRGILVDYLVYA